MINRDLIRRKIVQLTYAYYQNSDHNMDNAEKELMFSLSKSYDLYNYMLQLIVAITQEARKRYDVDVARAKREGEQEPSPRFAFNKFALQLEENKMLLEWIDVKHSNWDEDIEMVRKVYTAITSSDLYADYVSGAIDEELADLDEYSRDREVWRRIYKQFIQKLRETYPTAPIILTTTILCHDPNWDRSIEQVCQELGDDSIYHFLYEKNGVGTPGHIRIPEAEQMAEELAAFITSLGDGIWEDK